MQSILVFSVLALASSHSPVGPPQHSGASDAPRFAPARRISAQDAFAGSERLFPSPVLFDVDGDGHRDLVVADLRGSLTVAPGLAEAPGRFGKEVPLEKSDGNQLDFSNW